MYPDLFILTYPPLPKNQLKYVAGTYTREYMKYATAEEKKFYDDLYIKIKPEMTFNETVGYDYLARADKFSTVSAYIDTQDFITSTRIQMNVAAVMKRE